MVHVREPYVTHMLHFEPPRFAVVFHPKNKSYTFPEADMSFPFTCRRSIVFITFVCADATLRINVGSTFGGPRADGGAPNDGKPR